MVGVTPEPRSPAVPATPLPPTTTTVPAPPPPHDADGPPPPPPAARRAGDRGARATAATWVAATGALLLLAAAGTFLAVAWDTMSLTARIAVVGAATGAAILGGHRLRRPLPAVGAVVFHLGALLVPVDVLGLTLQLEVTAGGQWLATGTVAVVAWSVLAVAGRSRVLGWCAVGAVPVAATGVGLVSAVPPALVVVLAGAALLAFAPEPLRPAGPSLAIGALVLPLVAAATVAVVPSGGAGWLQADLAAAGWATRWELTLLTGCLAIAVLVVGATRQRSSILAAQAPIAAALTVLLVLVDDRTPDLAALLALPVLALVVELAAVATVRDRFWGRITRTAAGAVELSGLLVLPWLAWVLLAPQPSGAAGVGEWALATAVVGVAWMGAAGRRWSADGARRDGVVVTVALAGLHLATAIEVASPGSALVPWALVVLGVVSTGWIPGLLPFGSPRGEARDRTAPVEVAGGWPAAIGVAVTMAFLALVTGWSSSQLPWLALGGLAVLFLHVRAAADAERGDASASLALLLPASIAIILAAANAPALTSLPSGLHAVLVVGALLALATAADRIAPAADLVRVVAVMAALWLPEVAWTEVGADPDQTLVLDLLGPTREAVAVTLLASAWLVLDAVRRARPRIAALAAPVLVRGVVAAGLLAGLPLPIAGMMLLVTGAAALAVLGLMGSSAAAPWRFPAGVLAAATILPGWLLLGSDERLRAWTLVVYGATAIAAGVLRRRPVVGHVGGVVTTLGVWWLFSLEGVVGTDLWVLPVAAQLWVAGVAARRGGTSSWIADVPPLLLVVVPALAERLAGGPGWHAVLAGGVAVVAVAGGGARRLGGPLVVGTIALVAVVLVETFAFVASVPTWAWLAVGGAVLLGVAVFIERTGASPVTTAKRLVEVIDERFD
jgi:hypothetical protein